MWFVWLVTWSPSSLFCGSVHFVDLVAFHMYSSLTGQLDVVPPPATFTHTSPLSISVRLSQIKLYSDAAIHVHNYYAIDLPYLHDIVHVHVHVLKLIISTSVAATVHAPGRYACIQVK